MTFRNSRRRKNKESSVWRPRKTVTLGELVEVLDLPQNKAAERLKISVSTLKKRYKELLPNFGRWPYVSSWNKEGDESRKPSRYKRRENRGNIDKRMTLEHLIHKEDVRIRPSFHGLVLRAVALDILSKKRERDFLRQFSGMMKK